MSESRFHLGVCAIKSAALAVAVAAVAALTGAGGPAERGAFADPPAGNGAMLDTPGGFASTHVIVRAHPDIEPARLADGRWTFAQRQGVPLRPAADQATTIATNILAARGAMSVRPALAVTPANENLARDLGLDRAHRIELPPATNTPLLADELRALAALFESVELDGVGSVATAPNDPQFIHQYGLLNNGQIIPHTGGGGVAGVTGADIRALAAWNITTGDDDLLIAVIDSGVNAHIDLTGRLLTGFNVVTQTTDTADGCNSHGTHVAGIIAANTNNSFGIAGVTWQSKVIPIIVLSGCSGAESDAAAGVVYATDAGADIINMSLQYSAGTTTLHDAIKYAYNSGVVVVAAAGNNGFSGGVAFPARWPETIAVAATTNQDTRWTGSNQGPELSVAAPGQNTRSLFGIDSASYKTGTSFAAPHVSGTAALMLSIDPSLTPDEVRSVLEQTADDLGTPGFNEQFGHGRINAHAALIDVVGPIPGDANGDGVVNIFDLLFILADWGECDDPEDCPADVTGDGTVNIFDLLFVLANWG